MSAGNVDLVIDQGEDWTAQLVWSDFTENPMRVTEPMRMEIKAPGGTVIATLTPPEEPPEAGEIPPITYNTDSGLIQLHMPKAITNMLIGGLYAYDLFASVDDGEEYAGVQLQRIIYGNIIAKTRTTTGI